MGSFPDLRPQLFPVSDWYLITISDMFKPVFVACFVMIVVIVLLLINLCSYGQKTFVFQVSFQFISLIKNQF